MRRNVQCKLFIKLLAQRKTLLWVLWSEEHGWKCNQILTYNHLTHITLFYFKGIFQLINYENLSLRTLNDALVFHLSTLRYEIKSVNFKLLFWPVTMMYWNNSKALLCYWHKHPLFWCVNVDTYAKTKFFHRNRFIKLFELTLGLLSPAHLYTHVVRYTRCDIFLFGDS